MENNDESKELHDENNITKAMLPPLPMIEKALQRKQLSKVCMIYSEK